jgi:hypothetical protein
MLGSRALGGGELSALVDAKCRLDSEFMPADPLQVMSRTAFGSPALRVSALAKPSIIVTTNLGFGE